MVKKMVNSVMPNYNTDLIVWLQDLANSGLDYIIDFIRTQAGPNSLPVGIFFLY
jgi:hypothetical protein